MLTLNDLLRVGETGLIAHRARMAVTSHNVTNVNTPGYHRQMVQLTTQPPMTTYGTSTYKFSFGTGVKIADIIRIYDQTMEDVLRDDISSGAASDKYASTLRNIQNILSGTGTANLTLAMQQFWTSWQEVANNAGSLTSRTLLVQRTLAMAAEFNNLDNRLTSYQDSILRGTLDTASGALSLDVNTVNDLAESIAKLNRDIVLMALRGNQVNDMMDKRDQLVGELAEKTDFTLVREPDKSYTISIDGQILVQGATFNEVQITNDSPPELQLNGMVIEPAKGAIAGWIAAYNEADAVIEDLDTLAAALIAEVNVRHLQGYDIYGYHATNDYASPHEFFTGTTASDIALDQILVDDPGLIAAAATRHDAGPPPLPNVGDGANALAIADLCTTPIAALDELSCSNYFTRLLTQIGAKVQTADDTAAHSNAVISSMKEMLLSSTGVNIDEEMVEMLSAQRAFQASAKIINTADFMLDTLLNMKR